MKLLLMIILSFSLLSVPVNIPAAQDDTAEETTTTETFGYYLSEDAYFYSDMSASSFTGKILKGTRLHLSAVNNGMAYVEYDGKYGYVKEDLLTENPDDIKDATETMTSIDSSDVEILYPASHYFDTYDYMAINALAQFTSDGRDDNYVIVCSSDPIVVNGGELMIAAENGVEDVTIQYSKDKQNTDVYLRIPTSDSAKDANIDLSFEFGNNSIIFKNDRFDRKILIGLPADRYENVKMGDKTYTASEDNIVWIETASPSDITFTVIPQNVIYGTDSDNESTESMEMPDLKKTSKKHDYKWMYVSIGIIAVLLICIKSIISKVNKNRMKKK